MKKKSSRFFAGLLCAVLILSCGDPVVSAREPGGKIRYMPETPGSWMEEGMPESSGEATEEGMPETSGKRPEEGAPGTSDQRPEEGAPGTSDQRTEEGVPGTSDQRPEEGAPGTSGEQTEEGMPKDTEGADKDADPKEEEDSDKTAGSKGTEDLPEEDRNGSRDDLPADGSGGEADDPAVKEDEGIQKASEEQSRESTGGQAVMKGAVEVLITAGVPVEKEQEFQVTLNNGKDGTQKAILSKAADGALNAPRTSVRFLELEAGAYELRVSGSGYLTYTQTIQVDGLAYRVQLYTGEAAVGTETAKPGLLARGDLNQDGVLDHADVDMLIDALDAGIHEERYDLYGDGKTDLLDLNYLTRTMGERHEASLERFVPLDASELELKGGRIQSGDREGFLKGEGGITLAADGTVTGDQPLELSFDFSAYGQAPVMEEILVGAPKNMDHAVTEGTVLVETEDGSTVAGRFSAPGMSLAAVQEKEFSIERNQDGSLRISLGGQIAVKKVTLRITKTADGKNLAEISRVEFVNDMESRIPEPEMNIPANVSAEPGNKSFTVKWTAQTNVTAYEVRVESEGKTDYRKTTASSITIQQFLGDKMTNGIPYEVRVQSLNGEWKSGYSGAVTVIPKPDGKPPAPDRVKVTGGYRSLEIRWAKMKDTDGFNLYYKEEGAADYERITGINGTYYKLEGLKDNTRYVVYLTGTNELGEGPASLTASDQTISGLVAAKLPEYRLINTSNGAGKLSSHIVSASIGGGSVVMVDSPLDTEDGSALGAFDNSYTSYVNREDWDFGGAYPAAGKGVTAQLDDVYEIGMITLAQPMDTGSYSHVNIQYVDENGQRKTAQDVSIARRADGGSRYYYLIKLKEPIRASSVQIGVGQSDGRMRSVTISEIRFYEYDSLEHDILDLYADDLYLTLKEHVDASVIEGLQERLDTPDPVSKEYHPERSALQKELDAARQLLETSGLGGVIRIDPNITAKKDSGLSVGGLVSRQPLGVTAAAEEQIVVYVGNPGTKTGASASLQLVFTQQHAESDGLTRTASLKIGRNEITVPKFSSTDVEKGGALYIQYTGNNAEDQYAVRVSGGTVFPVLNLYGVSGAERTERIRQYAEELQKYVGDLQGSHADAHRSSENQNVNAYEYDAHTCILNMTDIVTDHMMLSVPASQVLAGLGEDKVSRLQNTTQAMDDMLRLFYQHKGLTDSFADGTSQEAVSGNHLPHQYLNIRYMKMFAGAFMYASGDHIGIEWGSVPGLMGGVPVTADADGRYQSGSYFGWGIAHEIGHQINQSAYAHAEVTNNYFSVLAQARDTNESVRFQYPKVYEKVTSGSTGYADNVFTQLGMYWQLHLAYDRDYNYKTYGTWQETIEHLFFARVDSYVRDPASAPSPKGVALTLNGGRDQNLMRLASAAAERDLTEFFTRWGMVPDQATRSYMGQFSPEERAIYYVDDAARVYEMTHGTGQSIAGKDAVTAIDMQQSSDGRVDLKITSSVSSGLLQGYEIIRVFTEWGEEKREIAGFTQSDTFTDQISFAANHVVAYEVRAVDRFMQYSNVYKAGSVKAGGSGYLSRSGWTVESNLTSADDRVTDATEELPCEPTLEHSIDRVIDGKDATVFTGSAESEDPYIILQLNRLEEVCALGYTCGSGTAVSAYRIEVSTDGEHYQEAGSGTFNLKNGTAKVYFHDSSNRICTFDTAYVKLTAVGQQGKALSIAELDLYGPSGDNVELSGQGIGILQDDYAYAGEDGRYVIPAGSILFTGTYKGNPAYNVVVLYDENGRIVGGTDSDGTLTAHQIILAPPLADEDALLGEVSEGIWIYWFEPKDGVSEDELPKKVRAELYRVDDALTNEGQRLVSDTVFVQVPEKLGPVTLESGVEN